MSIVNTPTFNKKVFSQVLEIAIEPLQAKVNQSNIISERSGYRYD
ncbi:MAG: hypothetical protein QNJ38_18725 [Prochloraceae cyanobacterium]|nr:hypothetical protein [Prochloraceae cyanobacterium]